MGTNRVEFQELAAERLADANALLAAGRYGCAYYVSGYAIECGLKACIAKQTRQDDFPRRDAASFYIHDLKKLRDSAGLDFDFQQTAGADPLFEANWGTVSSWKEDTRYQNRGQQDAEAILQLTIRIMEYSNG